MSLAQDHLDRWLTLDVERCFKGQEPRLGELARAPLVEKWQMNLVCELMETPSFIQLKNAMSLTGHLSAPTKSWSRRQDWSGSTATENGREPGSAPTGYATVPTPAETPQ
jgi:hypothetical protein